MPSVSSMNDLLILCASGQHGSPPAPQDSQKTGVVNLPNVHRILATGQ